MFARIGRLLKTKIEDFIVATVETRYKFNQSCDLFAPSGDDSPPLKDDRLVVVGIDGAENAVAVGVLNKSQGAKEGEKILFSRNDKGEVQAIIKLLGDGKIEIEAPKGYVLDAKDGKVVIGNSQKNLEKIFESLVNNIKNIVTTGSPPTHTVNEATKKLFDNFLNNEVKGLLE